MIVFTKNYNLVNKYSLLWEKNLTDMEITTIIKKVVIVMEINMVKDKFIKEDIIETLTIINKEVINRNRYKFLFHDLGL